MRPGDHTPDEGLLIEVEHPARAFDTAALEALVRRAAAAEGFAIRYLGIVLTDRAAVHALNRDFLGHDYETDVVSFPLDEDAVTERVMDGEVYVDLDTAAARAPEFGATFEHEACRYVLHGVLHLMGYDDATDGERAAMRALEDRYLGGDEPESW